MMRREDAEPLANAAVGERLSGVVEVLQHEIVACLPPRIRGQRKTLVLFAEAFLAGPQRLLSQFAVGDIHGCTGHTHECAVVGVERAASGFHPAHTTVSRERSERRDRIAPLSLRCPLLGFNAWPV